MENDPYTRYAFVPPSTNEEIKAASKMEDYTTTWGWYDIIAQAAKLPYFQSPDSDLITSVKKKNFWEVMLWLANQNHHNRSSK